MFRLIVLLSCVFISSLFADYEENLVYNVAEVKTGLDIHGLVDFSFKNDYITPRGLLVTNTDLTLQILTILSLDVYNQKDSCNLNKVTVFGGFWNDIWTGQRHPTAGYWNEFDWFAGVNFYARNWIFGVQFLQLVSPPGNFRPESNIEFLLGYDDSYLNNPIVVNPYIKFFWAVAGDSTVVVGRRGDTYDVEIGIVPTYKITTCCLNDPIIVTAPTWVTVGPESYWNGGPLGLKHVHCNYGVFSSGLRVEFPLTFIPKRLGRWYTALGGQYFYLINKNLLQAQTQTLGLSSYHHGHRNIGVANLSIGFSF